MMRNIHNKLSGRYGWYHNWHNHPRHEQTHFGVLLLSVALATSVILTSFVANKSIASVNQVYISQNGGGAQDGSSCTNAKPVTFFNTLSNWGTASTQIGPGSVVRLCGTITTNLTVQASGVSGSPITVLFETGAKISMPVCPPRGSGCINTNRKTFITIDGGTNGIIENTANGSALANHSGSYAITAYGCSNCEIKNLTIQNIYLRTSNTDLSIDQTSVRCIEFSGSNILIHNNVMHDAGWCITNSYENGDTNVRVYNNDIYNVDHAYTLATTGLQRASGFYFYNNHVHDYANWDSPTNDFHHDGIHAYGVPDSQGRLPVATEFWIYNNVFDGDIGNNITGHIFLEGGSGSGSTPWTDGTGVVHVFNNVFLANHVANGIVGLYMGSNFEFYNNTVIGPTSSDGVCLSLRDTVNPKIKNNFISGCNQLMSISNVPVANPAADINYNAYANCLLSYNCWWVGSVDTANFSTYQSQTGMDPNSLNLITTNGGMDSTGHPLSGSPVIRAGANLTSVGITALNADLARTPRPSTGAWDIGAYQSGGSVSIPPTTPPPPPPVPTVSISVSPSSITSGNSSVLSWSSTNATSCIGTNFTPSGISGSVSVSPTVTTAHTISCSGNGGTATAQTTITVTAPIPTPTPTPVPVPVACSTGSTVWQNTALTTQTGTFTVNYDVTPNTNNMDGVIGLSSGTASVYTNLSAIARFNDMGVIDAMNSSAYSSLVVMPYTAGTKYHIRMVVNPQNQTYSVYVTAPGVAEVQLANNYNFRTTALTTSLDNWAMLSGIGNFTVCNFTLSYTPTINPTPVPTPTSPPPTSTSTVSSPVPVVTSTIQSTNKFLLNDRIKTNSRVKVRQTPTTTGKAICTQNRRALGTVIGGPQVADGYTWWKINYDSFCDGWSAQDYLDLYSRPVAVKVETPTVTVLPPQNSRTGFLAAIIFVLDSIYNFLDKILR